MSSLPTTPPLISRGFFVKFKLNKFTFFSTVYNFYLANRKYRTSERKTYGKLQSGLENSLFLNVHFTEKPFHC